LRGKNAWHCCWGTWCENKKKHCVSSRPVSNVPFAATFSETFFAENVVQKTLKKAGRQYRLGGLADFPRRSYSALSAEYVVRLTAANAVLVSCAFAAENVAEIAKSVSFGFGMIIPVFWRQGAWTLRLRLQLLAGIMFRECRPRIPNVQRFIQIIFGDVEIIFQDDTLQQQGICWILPCCILESMRRSE